MNILKIIRLGAVFIFASTFYSPSRAHDFWLAPNSYNVAIETPVDVSIMIGHPTDRTDWPIDPHRVISFRSLGPSGISDHQSAIADYRRTKDLPLSFTSSGTHLLTIETTQAYSKFGAEAFNAYLDEEGLTSIKIDRAAKRKSNTAGTELYSRRGKSIIHVGELGETDPEFITQPVGMTLEIVPSANPIRLSKADKMTSTVFYRGMPKAGVSVGLVDLSGDGGQISTQISDKNGNVTFPRPSLGNWMQHAVWSDPIEVPNRADYDTVFSSLSFNIR